MNNGRFQIGDDDITIRHSRWGNVIFVDGHPEPVLPKFWQARDTNDYFLNLDPTRTD